PHFYKGVRPLGMGGAFTAVADDENALFYNPAGLNRVESWSMGLINPLVEASDSNVDLYEDIEDTDLDVTAEVTDLIRDNLGETFHTRVALFPHVVMKNFAIGALAQGKTNVEFRNAANPEINVEAVGSGSAHVGLAHGWMDENLRLGLGLKYIVAGHLQAVYDAGDIASSTFEDQVDDDTVDDSGFGFDLGAMYTLPVKFDPIVGLTILNVADTDLGDAGELSQQVNIGFSATHQWRWLDLTGAVDWMDVLEDAGTDDDMFKRLHFGLEAKFPKILSLRTGLSQGYGAFGLGLDFKLLKLEYANYAEEMASYTGGKPDRRHVVQVSLGW
ncbi:MAG: hypothetical protein C0618_00005, partial [Desulfuromonas sp.]